MEVRRFYKYDLYINLTKKLFDCFTTPFYADFESLFPHDKNREIKIVIGVDLFMVLSLPLLDRFLASFEFIILL